MPKVNAKLICTKNENNFFQFSTYFVLLLLQYFVAVKFCNLFSMSLRVDHYAITLYGHSFDMAIINAINN